MTSWLPDYVIQYGLPIGTAIISLGGWVVELRRRKKAEEKGARAERELRDIERRAMGPFLEASYIITDVSDSGPIHAGGGVPEATLVGTKITLHLSNAHGRTAKKVNTTLPDGSWTFWPDGGVISASCSVSYRYSPGMRGLRQRIRLRFDAENGRKLYHVYETIHGFAHLERVDPQ